MKTASLRPRRRYATRAQLNRESCGMTAGEASHLRRGAVRVVDRLSDRQLGFAGQQLWRFVEERAPMLGLDMAGRAAPEGAGDYPAALRALAAEMRTGPRLPRTALDRRLGWLAGVLGLDRVERAVMGAFARFALFDSWRALAEAVPFRSTAMTPAVLATFTGEGAVAIEERLSPGAPLLRSGLVEDDRDGEFSAGRFLQRIARSSATDPETLAGRVTPAAPPSSLEWEDFAHLGPARDVALRLLDSGAAVSLLLHGAPGTGKTEFARALADRLGRQALFAGLADDAGGEPTRSERLAHLSVLRALTRHDPARLIVVDEADDVLRLGEGRERAGSKLWLNRLVEAPEVPTIWIANDPAALGSTIVRRMGCAIGFDLPPPSVRARVVARAAAMRGVTLDQAEVARIAALPATPAVLANAVASAGLAGGDGATARMVGEGILAALRTPVPRNSGAAGAYDPALAQADQDLAELADRLAGAPGRGWSLLLCGPPGTGKSAYARQLAGRLGIEVIEKRGSDLLGAYVGQTEAAIAGAFRQAAAAGAMLLIDEADSFLFDRAGAHRSWEAGMVNEMLRWMEDHPAPFVATTNLADRLDPATQRRFTLAVRFRPLTPARAVALFAATFGQALPPGTEPLDALTPGDFGVVAKRAALLGEERPAELLRWLRAEAEARGGVSKATGFHRPAVCAQSGNLPGLGQGPVLKAR